MKTDHTELPMIERSSCPFVLLLTKGNVQQHGQSLARDAPASFTPNDRPEHGTGKYQSEACTYDSAVLVIICRTW